jgi:tetratricopeptide (TPR) repeat protein
MKKILYFILTVLSISEGFSQTADDYNTRGSEKYNKKDYRGAITEYTKAIAINPKHVWANYNRGLSKQNMEDYRGAIADFTAAIENSPDEISLYFSRGIAKSNLQDYRGAITDYTKVIENIIIQINKSVGANPDSLIVFPQIEPVMDGIKDSSSIQNINPRFAKAYLRRGKASFIIGDKVSGCSDLRKALALGNKEATVLIKKFCL